MKNVVMAFLTVALLGLTTVAQKQFGSGNLYTSANSAVNKPLTARLPPSCTCSCGKNCDGSSSVHYSGCSFEDGLNCVFDCCDAAPDPTPGECGGHGQLLP